MVGLGGVPVTWAKRDAHIRYASIVGSEVIIDVVFIFVIDGVHVGGPICLLFMIQKKAKNIKASQLSCLCSASKARLAVGVIL